MSMRLELDPDDLRRGEHETTRRWGMAIVVVAIVMLASAAALWAAWQVIGRHGTGGAVPLIRATAGPVKVRPANPGGMKVPDQNMYILNNGDKPIDSRVEELLPPPETPLPAPAPPAPTVTDASPAQASIATAPIPASAPPSVAALRAPAAAPAPSMPPAPVAAPQPKPDLARPTAAATSPPVAAVPHSAPPLGHGAYRVQVGAVRTPAEATAEWQRLKRLEPGVLGRLSVATERVDDGARGVFYRILAGPFDSATAASHACDALRRHKIGCFLAKP